MDEFDVCIPDNNEDEFIKIMEQLGIIKLIFLYEFKDRSDFEQKKKKISSLGKGFDIGLLVKDNNYLKAKDLTPYLFAKAPSRQLVESNTVKYLFGFESSEKKDFIHHRNSGLNQVLCKIIKEKDKILCFSVNEVLKAKDPHTILGRMMQNARFAKKYKLNTMILSFAKRPLELRAKREKESIRGIIQ